MEGDFPPAVSPLVFDQFQGIKTDATRPAIPDAQMSWCDGFIPFQPGFLWVLPDVGPALWPAPAGRTIVCFNWVNLSVAGAAAAPICIVFLDDGSIWQVPLLGLASQIAPPGTITTVNRANIGVTTWASQYVIIVAKVPGAVPGSAASNQYWIWDGTKFYAPGGIAPNFIISYGGVGYTSAPVVGLYGGNGPVTPTTLTATVSNGQVVSITPNTLGTGYIGTDVVGVSFAGGGAAGSTAILTPTIHNGTLASVSVFFAGSGYTSSASAQVLGGGGTGASIGFTQSGGSITGASVTAPGSGYISTPTIIFSDPNNPVAQAQASLMPLGIAGTDVQVYSGRVWVINGNVCNFSGPGSVNSFSTSIGGGNFTSTDSFLQSAFTKLINTNGFLYFIGDSSVSYVSGVSTSGTPPTTTFTFLNADPEMGSIWPGSVTIFGRNIIFINAVGAHVAYGGAVTKISDDLDGVFDTEFTLVLQPSSAKAYIASRKIFMFLLQIFDPITGLKVNKLFMWNGKRWFSSQQGITLLYIGTLEFSSNISAWATDGASLYQMFASPSSNFTKTVQSKLWATPGSYANSHATSRLWGLFNMQSTALQTVNISIDTEDEGVFNFQPYVVGKGSVDTYVLPPTEVAQQGVLTGLTLQTTAPVLGIVSLMLGTETVQYRG